MEDRNTSTTTNESLREAGKQSNPVMYGWKCPVMKYVSKHNYSFVPKI